MRGFRKMPKVLLTEAEREQDKVFKRMDKFDAVVTEYLRSTRSTIEILAERIGVDPSTLWRYRRQIKYFQKAPFDVICKILKLANVSNETLRFICGL